MATKVRPPNMVLWKLDFTESKKNLPKKLAMVGISRAPHRTRVADTGFDKGGNSFSFEGSAFATASTLKNY